MYYPDLSPYRTGGAKAIVQVYPGVKNIGWLGKCEAYSKDDVPKEAIQKLKEVLFLDLKNSDDKRKGIYDVKRAINVHTMHMRGSPYTCPICDNDQEVLVKPDGLRYYSGSRAMLLGTNEICIPSLRKDEFYSCPTMIYHYVVDHGYRPPQEFLDALSAFDLEHPYDVDKEQENLECIDVPATEVDSFNR